LGRRDRHRGRAHRAAVLDLPGRVGRGLTGSELSDI
jgi:hypothetical protein